MNVLYLEKTGKSIDKKVKLNFVNEDVGDVIKDVKSWLMLWADMNGLTYEFEGKLPESERLKSSPYRYFFSFMSYDNRLLCEITLRHESSTWNIQNEYRKVSHPASSFYDDRTRARILAKFPVINDMTPRAFSLSPLKSRSRSRSRSRSMRSSPDLLTIRPSRRKTSSRRRSRENELKDLY